MKQTANYQLNQWEQTDRIQMADFNADNSRVDQALAGLQTALSAETATRSGETAALQAAVAGCGNCFVQCGSYKGSGSYGGPFPQSLSFAHKPALIIIRDGDDPSLAHELVLIQGATQANGQGDSSSNLVTVTWSGNSVSWYSSGSAAAQYSRGVNYYYVAFLMAE